MININISFNGMEASDALREYVTEKLSKHEELLVSATKIDVEFIQNVHAKGVKGDFRLEINVYLPKALVRVEETGSDMYAIIDVASDTLTRRIRRYHDRRTHWEGTTPWRVLEANEELADAEDDLDDYSNYAPKISSRKKLDNMTPMNEGEAIEKMELMGQRQMLFKNISSGKVSMVYAKEDGGYALVEPGDELSM